MSSAFRTGVHISFWLCLLVVSVKSHTTACNHGNDTTCLYGNATYPGVHQLMQNTEYFWFGKGKYSASCPDSLKGTVPCWNPAPNFQSILTRMRMSDDNDTSGIEQYLRVHWGPIPADSYRGCGSRIQVPATDKHVDPVHTIYTDSWALNHKPHVSWQRQGNDTYTLAFWDAGWFQLNGLWININGERLMGAEEVVSYRGPLNPMPRKNPVLIALFRQSQQVDRATAFTAVTAQLKKHGYVKMNTLMTDLELDGPVAVSVVRNSVDTFSAQYGIRLHLINSCPYLLDKAMRISSSRDQLPWNVTAAHLSVSIEVTYDRPAVEFESCCQTHKMPRGRVEVDPRAPEALDTVHTRQAPVVTLTPTDITDDMYFFSVPGRYFTLLFVDLTQSTINVTNKAVVHWQIINIRDPKLATGETILAYEAPHTTVASPERRLAFLLMEQSRALTRQEVTALHTANCVRCNTDVQKLMTDLNLTLVGMTKLRSKMDDFARRRIYTEGGSKADACAGVAGFADPCPSPQPPACRGVVSLPSILALMLCLAASLAAFPGEN
ncbi:uncharacterized protein C56G2.4-like [Babylonia areolata]|uniref:uncharacterized protein C56G2.4-like n=1 Tax=Babylonia areolata TaxID=304850 RepID=UPI003FD5365B